MATHRMLDAFQEVLRQVGEIGLADLFLTLSLMGHQKQRVYKDILSWIDRDYFRLTISNKVFNFKSLIQMVQSVGKFVKQKYQVKCFYQEDFQIVDYLVYCVLKKDDAGIL